MRIIREAKYDINKDVYVIVCDQCEMDNEISLEVFLEFSLMECPDCSSLIEFI